ncbi:Uncharacterised protein [Klebsiella pneumoniae]|nr:Uncharacterised protein [Klebsiella pneumoniae]
MRLGMSPSLNIRSYMVFITGSRDSVQKQLRVICEYYAKGQVIIAQKVNWFCCIYKMTSMSLL